MKNNWVLSGLGLLAWWIPPLVVWPQNLPKEQEEAIKELRDAGCDVKIGPVFFIHFHRAILSEKVWQNVKKLPAFVNLDFGFSHIGDSDLKQLTELPRTEWLLLDSTKVTDMGLEHVKTLQNLRGLG